MGGEACPAGPDGWASPHWEEDGRGCDGHAQARPGPGGDEGLGRVGGDEAVWTVGLVVGALGDSGLP